jgi:TolB-like protein/AraC-like DNA-binding protein
MSDPKNTESGFLAKITDIIMDNIANEQFGVSDLADRVGMSRSNLLRKVKQLANISVSQFIRQIRLKEALRLLKHTSLTISEISFKVGFGSTSYFIKCFHDHYGYPPGEYTKVESSKVENKKEKSNPTSYSFNIIFIAFGLLIVIITLFIILKPQFGNNRSEKKSIAVLPFKNDSNDSTNIYIINGLMESVLNNLQKIEGLRVISRTSVEKYRNNPKSIPEIANDLNVDYVIEGSGQKINDHIMLNIQLIEAQTDNHLWAEQYNRQTKDIFSLQSEIAKKIAGEIQVIITPEEEDRINSIPTDNMIAYDYFLEGLEQFYKGNGKSLIEAISYFEKAIEHDENFARAYADIAISYYLLDIHQIDKKYSAEINSFADKALLIDPKLPQSLMAKAMYYLHSKEYEMAIPYMEKALEYNPNSALVINMLSDFYTNYLPNSEKYLEYALMGVELDIGSHDSVTASYIFLHLSNAFIQLGFVDEAELYIRKSLKYNPQNLYSQYVYAFVLYAKDKSLIQTKKLLIETLQKDPTRLDVLQEVAKICYYMRDYDSSYLYYSKFVAARKDYNLNIYNGENAKIGCVYSHSGYTEESDSLFTLYKKYADNDNSIYKDLSLAAYYSFYDDTVQSMYHLEKFSHQSDYHYWIVLFLEIDPLFDNVKELPEFQRVNEKLKSDFQIKHSLIRESLEKKGLL